MSGRKNNLRLYQNIVNGNMALSSIISDITDIQFLDNIAIQLNFTGAPVGVAAVQVSIDHAQDFNGNVSTAGNWVTIASSSMSGGSPILFDLNQVSATYIRVVYTRTSGSGTLQSFISAKMI